jgi:hypothetical protein
MFTVYFQKIVAAHGGRRSEIENAEAEDRLGPPTARHRKRQIKEQEASV